jgi:pSer/pThr/pTyr-binding forkhead associated (FHA) protein
MPKFFLVHYPEEPVRVPDKGSVSIGRADDNTIILTEPRVSRKHSQIEWQDKEQAFALSDVGSSNGTYLNGKKVAPGEKHTLKDWDKIRIASSVFTARFVDTPSIIKNEFKKLSTRVHFEKTEILRFSDLDEGAIDSAFSGDLEHLTMVELLQMLESGSKTGILTVKTDLGEGVFTIKEGMIILARLGTAADENAVYEVLKCKQGTFAFNPRNSINEAAQIQETTSALLMEGCRLLDEENASGRPGRSTTTFFNLPADLK